MFDAEDLPRSATIHRATLAMVQGFTLEKCCPCGGWGMASIDRLIETHGRDITINDLLPRLRCKQCGRHGWDMAVYLVEGMFREPCGGPSPGWSLPLHTTQPEKLAG